MTEQGANAPRFPSPRLRRGASRRSAGRPRGPCPRCNRTGPRAAHATRGRASIHGRQGTEQGRMAGPCPRTRLPGLVSENPAQASRQSHRHGSDCPAVTPSPGMQAKRGLHHGSQKPTTTALFPLYLAFQSQWVVTPDACLCGEREGGMGRLELRRWLPGSHPDAARGRRAEPTQSEILDGTDRPWTQSPLAGDDHNYDR